ncbi:IS5 family transposase [Labrys sp. ZIDIC5]|nr:IS5 family transposase [Labrys sp. ZIDIC5]MDZ5454593.1 IS5 family transposase [Labrys sp. ZIDIC5]
MTRRRYELTDHEWSIISPLLPNKPRGVPRADDRRVLNGILWRFRTGSPWAEVPERYSPPTTCYNRFVRWRKAGVWDRLLQAVSAAYDGDIIMIDSTCVRVHQHAATGKKGGRDDGGMGRSRGGLTSKIHALVDGEGRPVNLRLTGGQVADCTQADALTDELGEGDILLADKGYDSNAIRARAAARKAWANIPPKTHRKASFVFSRWVYRQRNLVERFFNRIKQFRGIATRYARYTTVLDKRLISL